MEVGAPEKADWRKARRMRAWELSQARWTQKQIAQALEVSKGAVSQWVTRGRERGVAALKAHPATGAASRLTADQHAQIPDLLARGAERYGFRGDVWTARRVAEVVYCTFGVRYSRDHMGALLRTAGWSRQRPIERATQRDEQSLADGHETRWPAIKKKPRRTGPPSSE